MDPTLFPIATLPACVTKCGPLYDVNGACVPPVAPAADQSTYESCFCNEPRLAPFKTGTSGVCDAACTENPADLGVIQGWFADFCKNVEAGNGNGDGNTAPTPTGSPRPGGKNSGGGRSWLDGHYQWVIFAVIMVVAIVGIWVGACVWRRRYLRKKDRMYALGTNMARATESGRVVPNDGSSAGSVHAPAAGMFDPAPLSSAGVYGEKEPKSKKWALKGRT